MQSGVRHTAQITITLASRDGPAYTAIAFTSIINEIFTVIE